MTIKYDRLPEDVRSRIPDAATYLSAHHRVVFAYLFGSMAGDTMNPLSDVDIAVYLLGVSDLEEERLEILGELANILGTDEIDLVILNTAPLPLKARIVRNRKVLADKKPTLRCEFESLVLREYFDFSVKERDIFARRFSVGR